jgi:hypothetical protein
MAAYSAMVIRHDAPSAAQKPTPPRSSAGSTRNIGKVGSTNQKVDCDSAAIPSLSAVSRHSQMKARMEISGRDRISAPRPGLRLAISDTMAMMMPEMSALMAR